MPWRTITERYEPVQVPVERKGECPSCGKKVTRRRTFEHTVNPFNKNPDGTVRTYAEVLAQVKAEANEWEPDFRHNTEACMGGAA